MRCLEAHHGCDRRQLPYADEVDEIQANENREISFATRERLVERVNRLSAALHAVPEVQTCVRCQDGIERFSRRMSPRSNRVAGHRRLL
jgi:RNA polymerase-binding transcription factor DksA